MAQQAKKATAANANRPPVKDRLKKKGRVSVTVPICTDDEIAQRIEDLRQEKADAELQLAGLREGSQLAANLEAKILSLGDQLDAAKADAEPFIEKLRFESIGNKAYDRLVDKHPPTPEQVAEAEKMGAVRAYDPETFLPELMALSLRSINGEPVEFSVEDINDIWDEWNNSEMLALIQGALGANTTRRTVADWGNG